MADSPLSSSELNDRLSNLPEHILLHIFSFLPSKDVVATSVLSKAWQLLWTLVPTIDLDDSTFSLYGNGFEQLVSKVLDSNKSPIIRRFCLRGIHCKTSSLAKWLSSTTERNVEELDLTFSYLRNDVLPSQSSSSRSNSAFWRAPKSFKTLVVMKLMNTHSAYDSLFVISIGENLEGYFPTLKVLHLSNVWFESPDPSLSGIFASQFPLLEELVIGGGRFRHDINISLPMLQRFDIDCERLESVRKLRLNMEVPSLRCLVLRGSGRDSEGFGVENLHNLLDASLSSRFPLLEELVVRDAQFHHDINISLPKLRRLEIFDALFDNCTFNIESPSLQYLDLTHFESRRFRMENLHNLVEANVHVVLDNMWDYNDERGESLINFVNALFNVGRLNLSHYTMQELRRASSRSFFHADRIQPFHNLVKLDLDIDSSVLGIMMFMLSKFENLEHLKVEKHEGKYDRKKYSFAPPTYVPNCLTYHLKTFCFNRFTASKYQMEFTVYILKNSLVLENAKIVFARGLIWKKGYNSKTILSTSKGSMECQLEFDQDVTLLQIGL